MRFDPSRELDRLTRQMWGGRAAVMPMDAYRHGDRVVVHFDVPGVDPSSIDLTVDRDGLTVAAERRWQPEEGVDVVAAERPHGRFTRQLVLGEGVDVDGIEARYEHGVLTVTLPVAEEAKPRKVQISGGAGTAKAIQTSSSAA